MHVRLTCAIKFYLLTYLFLSLPAVVDAREGCLCMWPPTLVDSWTLATQGLQRRAARGTGTCSAPCQSNRLCEPDDNRWPMTRYFRNNIYYIGGFKGVQWCHVHPPRTWPRQVPGEAVWRLWNTIKLFSGRTLLGEHAALPKNPTPVVSPLSLWLRPFGSHPSAKIRGEAPPNMTAWIRLWFIFSPHRRWMLLQVSHVPCYACLCVLHNGLHCKNDGTDRYAVWGRLVLAHMWGACWRHPANTTEHCSQRRCGLYQITLITCYLVLARLISISSFQLRFSIIQ